MNREAEDFTNAVDCDRSTSSKAVQTSPGPASPAPSQGHSASHPPSTHSRENPGPSLPTDSPRDKDKQQRQDGGQASDTGNVKDGNTGDQDAGDGSSGDEYPRSFGERLKGSFRFGGGKHSSVSIVGSLRRQKRHGGSGTG